MLLAAVLLGSVGACPSTEVCGFPNANVLTAHAVLHPEHCCPVLPPTPLMNSSAVLPGTSVTPEQGFCPPRFLDTGYRLAYPGLAIKDLPQACAGDPPVCPDALLWRTLLDDSLKAQGLRPAHCEVPHLFYTQYANAFAEDYRHGIPVLASSVVPEAAVAAAQRTIREMVRQTTVQLRKHCPRCQDFASALASKYTRFTVWGDRERGFGNCESCASRCASASTAPDQMCCTSETSRLFRGRPSVGTLNCSDDLSYMRSQEYKICFEGKDGSAMPNVPQCVEPGGPDWTDPTAGTEELGICYRLADGTVYPGYQGRNIVIEEWFHTMHGIGIQAVDPEGYARIHASAVRLKKAGIWMSRTTKGHALDRYGANEFEFMAMAVQTWLGFPEWEGYFAYQSRAEIKRRDPELARVVGRYFEDSDWNPCAGIAIREPRPQTNSCNKGFFGVNPNHKRGGLWRSPEHVVQAIDANCSDPCAAAPGSALCGASTLASEYVGPPMEAERPSEVLL